MKPSNISVTCVLSDNRMLNFILDQSGNLSVKVTYKDKDHFVNKLSLEDIRVQQETAGEQREKLFSEIDRFGRQAILQAIDGAVKNQKILDQKCPVYFEIKDGEQIVIENGTVDKVQTVSNIKIFLKALKN